jgi:hypothetical protein
VLPPFGAVICFQVAALTGAAVNASTAATTTGIFFTCSS